MRERGQARRVRRVARAIRERLSYANVMSTIAMFGVLAGGGAYAISQIGPQDIQKNAVRGKHIKKNQVKAKHVAKNAVRTPEIGDGAVTAAKLAEGVAVLGPEGEQGDPGPPGVSGLVRVRTPSSLQASESVKFAQAICPAGQRVIGAGADVRAGVQGDPPNQTSEIVINEIIPSEETVVPGTVTVRAYENVATAEDWGVTAFALCADVS